MVRARGGSFLRPPRISSITPKKPHHRSGRLVYSSDAGFRVYMSPVNMTKK